MTLGELLSSFEAKYPNACNEDDISNMCWVIGGSRRLCTKVLSTMSDSLRLGLHSSGALPVVGPFTDS